MKRITAWLAAVLLWMTCAYAVPPVLNYAGKVTVDGEAYDGDGFFKFALVNEDGTKSYWSNDGTSTDASEPQISVSVSVQGGLYTVLLGNTALQGMSAMDPAVFAQYTDAKLRVWFSDGVNEFQQLSPDRPFASVPYALSAGTAQTAGSASIAKGAVNLDMLSQDVKTQINSPISHARLSAEVKADINATIGMNRLSLEVTEKLEKEGSTFDYETPVVGSIKAVPYGDAPPVGYSLYKQGEPRELAWEEMATASVPRNAYDGVDSLNGKIYFVGGRDSQNKSIVERFDPESNKWETVKSISVAKNNLASTTLNGFLWIIGGYNHSQNFNTFEYYNSNTDLWTSQPSLPLSIRGGRAISMNGKIFYIGGFTNKHIANVFSFDPVTNEWSEKSSMPTSRASHNLVIYQDRIWALGGGNAVESYDPERDVWQVEKSLNFSRTGATAWVANGLIFTAGGGKWINNGWASVNSIEIYYPNTKSWYILGNLPRSIILGDSVILDDIIYIVGGQNASNVYSGKVFAADLNAALDGVYDLYRKGGDAPVGTPVLQSEYADGSVTASKMADGAITTSKLSEQILKYLKPEITNQPQSSTIYAGQNASYSVTAEGKYLTYQWKKDGVDLTGETNATLNFTDANATQHDGNYSVVVGNDFGSVESEEVVLDVNTTLLNGLVAWWKFDETSGTVAYDSSGNRNDGNLTNGPTWTDGKIGGALSFDGHNDRVKLAHNMINGLIDITVSFWFLENQNNTDLHHFFSAASLTTDNRFLLALNSTGKFYYYDTENGKTKISFQYSETFTIWSNIVLVRSVSGAKLFINGTLKAETSFTNTNLAIPQNGFWLGGDQDSVGGGWSTTQQLNGLLDDVRIYDRALSAEEVQVLYNLGQ